MVPGIFAALFSGSPKSETKSLHDFRDELDIDGKPHDLSQHRGKVVLVSNVASA